LFRRKDAFKLSARGGKEETNALNWGRTGEGENAAGGESRVDHSLLKQRPLIESEKREKGRIRRYFQRGEKRK